MSFKLQEGNHSHYLKEGYIELLRCDYFKYHSCILH
jgi:hypothetical protein